MVCIVPLRLASHCNHRHDLLYSNDEVSMHGLMQDWPLVVTNILDYAAKFHGEQEVITCTAEGPTHRYTYADMHRRSKLCALALQRLGVRYAVK